MRWQDMARVLKEDAGAMTSISKAAKALSIDRGYVSKVIIKSGIAPVYGKGTQARYWFEDVAKAITEGY